MHHKDIKSKIRKQLKKKYPDWKRLPKKKKKEIAEAVLKEAVEKHEFDKDVETPIEELSGIEDQVVTDTDIMNIEQMGRYVENHYRSKMFDLREMEASKSRLWMLRFETNA